MDTLVGQAEGGPILDVAFADRKQPFEFIYGPVQVLGGAQL